MAGGAAGLLKGAVYFSRLAGSHRKQPVSSIIIMDREEKACNGGEGSNEDHAISNHFIQGNS